MPFGKPLAGTLLASLTLLGLATAHAKDDMKAASNTRVPLPPSIPLTWCAPTVPPT